MVLYYKFDNDTNPTHDFSSSGNDGILINNPDFNSSGGYLNDGAFEYYGNGSKIQLTNEIIINGSIGYTIMFWIKQNGTGTDRSVLGVPNTNENYLRMQGASNRFGLEFDSTSTNYYLSYSGIAETNWNHFTFVFSPNNETTYNVKLYANGDLHDEENYTIDFFNITYIGDAYSNYYFNGSIDDIAIFNKSLTANDVLNNYSHYVNECGSQPYSDCDQRQSVTYEKGIYYLNCTSDGGIKIRNSDIFVDGNNATLVCNWTDDITTGNHFAIRPTNNLENITITNFNIKNASDGIRLRLINDSFVYNITCDTSYIYCLYLLSSNNLVVDNIRNIKNTGNYSIWVEDTNNSIIKNSIFSRAYTYSFREIDYCYNNNITNNTFNESLINFKQSVDSNFNNNYIYGNYGEYPLTIWLTHNMDFDNNNFSLNYSNAEKSNYIYIINNTNLRFSNNTINHLNESRTTRSIQVQDNFNITFFNNTINWSDTAIRMSRLNNYTYIYNNTILNSYQDTDSYNVGIALNFGHNWNTFIKWNIINKSGTVGIFIRNASNVEVGYNIIDGMLYETHNLGDYHSISEPPTAIGIYKWFGDTSGNGLATDDDIYDNLSAWRSDNVTIYNNTYIDYDVYLRSNDCDGLNYSDTYSPTYKKWDMVYHIFRNDEWYLNPSFTNVTNYKYLGGGIWGYTDIFYQRSNKRRFVNYSIYNTYEYWVNTNDSDYQVNFYNLSDNIFYNTNRLFINNKSNDIINITISPLEYIYNYNSSAFNITKSWTNALFFYPNYSVNPNLINIQNNDGYFNVNDLIDYNNNMSYALDNFNCSESLQISSSYSCGRENSPIWFSSTTPTSKLIASNLTNTINTTIVLNVTNCNIRRITYSTHSNNFSSVYNENGTAGALSYTCSNNILTFNNLPIEQASGSNRFSIEYSTEVTDSCDNLMNGLGQFGVWMALIILTIVFAAMFNFITNQKNNLDGGSILKTYILGGIIVLVIAGILLVLGVIFIQTVC